MKIKLNMDEKDKLQKTWSVCVFDEDRMFFTSKCEKQQQMCVCLCVGVYV